MSLRHPIGFHPRRPQRHSPWRWWFNRIRDFALIDVPYGFDELLRGVGVLTLLLCLALALLPATHPVLLEAGNGLYHALFDPPASSD